MREEEKIQKGILFAPLTPELVEMKLKTHNLNTDFNKLYEDETEKREAILKEMFGEFGEGSFIQGPLYMHYGKHTKIGKRFFGNFDLLIQDDAEVVIGDDCNFGPRVTIVTPVHPLLPNERKSMIDANGVEKHLCYAKPVHIGHDCWFGANVTVCPGVTIGNNCVIAAGSVVVEDIPDNSLAGGVPAKVIREITEKDSMIYKPEILADNKVK